MKPWWNTSKALCIIEARVTRRRRVGRALMRVAVAWPTVSLPIAKPYEVVVCRLISPDNYDCEILSLNFPG